MIWFRKINLAQVNEYNKNSLVEHMGIELTEITDNELIGTMPVNSTTHQPFGILHGGANCVLAETLGSIASNLVVDPEKFHAVGLSIQTSHIKAVRNGKVRGVATSIHLGGTTHVWDIKTYDDANQLTSTTTLTMAIISKLGKS